MSRVWSVRAGTLTQHGLIFCAAGKPDHTVGCINRLMTDDFKTPGGPQAILCAAGKLKHVVEIISKADDR